MKNETIYEKINKVQVALLEKKLKKSGKNSFSKFRYFELEDILPEIMKISSKEKLMLTFRFTEKEAELYIIDIDTGDRFVNAVPMPEVKALNSGMNVVQSEGAYMTYLKRYLLLNTFGISEDSLIDSDELTRVEKAVAKKKSVKPRQKDGFVYPNNRRV